MTSVPYRTEVGYDFPIFEIIVTAEEQRRLHGHCDIADGVQRFKKIGATSRV